MGGALGAAARYGTARLVPVPAGGFPWATFWTNVAGSFVLGLLPALLVDRSPSPRHVRPFLATGFLGACTTYSTFAVETVVLAGDGHATLALAYVAASIAGGFLAAWCGVTVAGGVR